MALFKNPKVVSDQWIPSHCSIPGHAEVDRLVKTGDRPPQP